MTHFLYILFSTSASKFYIGETPSVPERINKHNQHVYAKAFSKIANDWRVVLSYECSDRAKALYLEKFIKRMKSKMFIEKIIRNPKILTDIISKK